MIRPVTCVCMLMAAGSGLYLYQAKHQAQLETREIRRLQSDAAATRQRAGVLLAEYQLENDPTRLADLSDKFLAQLKPTLPTQFTTMAEIERRLPPIAVPAASGQAPLEPDQPFAYPPAPATTPPPVTATTSPAAAPSAVPMARAEPAHEDPKPDPSRVATTAAIKPAPVATVQPQPASHPITLAASGNPAGASPSAAAAAAAAKPQPTRSVLASARETQPAYPPRTVSRQPELPIVIMHQPQQQQQPAPTSSMLASSQRYGYGYGYAPAAPRPPVMSALGMARTMTPSPVSAPGASFWTPGGGSN